MEREPRGRSSGNLSEKKRITQKVSYGSLENCIPYGYLNKISSDLLLLNILKMSEKPQGFLSFFPNPSNSSYQTKKTDVLASLIDTLLFLLDNSNGGLIFDPNYIALLQIQRLLEKDEIETALKVLEKRLRARETNKKNRRKS